MTELCLTILCPPAFEERVLDTLLMTPQVAVFTSTRAAAHGLSHAQMSATEQVMGMAAMTEIKALLTHADSEALLRFLKEEFSGYGLKYWLIPVIETGEFT